jgi:hypothetical protein
MEELQFGGQVNDCNFLRDRIYPVNIEVCKWGLRISNDRKEASFKYCAGNTVRNISLNRSYLLICSYEACYVFIAWVKPATGIRGGLKWA